jgi:hypothetical protein
MNHRHQSKPVCNVIRYKSAARPLVKQPEECNVIDYKRARRSARVLAEVILFPFQPEGAA